MLADRLTAALPLALLVCVLGAAGVAATPGVAVGGPLTTTAPQDPAASEAGLDLDRSTRRLIQQGLRNEGFAPGMPDGLFGPRTRAAIREWQQSRGASPTGYVTGAEAELLRTAAMPPPAAADSSPPPPAEPAVEPGASSVAAPPASTAEAASNPAPTAVSTEADPQNAAVTNTERTARPAPGSVNAQLPPEIMVDRHLIRAERLLATDDPAAALDVMNEILALRDEHDVVLEDDFYFQYAQVAFAAERTENAIAALNEYLVTAGRAGALYREALELLDSVEVRLLVERQRFRDCETCPEMVILPGGDVALGRYEVTVEEYRAFTATANGGAGNGCLGPGENHSWRNPGFHQTDRHPVTCVSVEDALAYVSWLSRTSGETYRLPTWMELVRGSEGSEPGCYNELRSGDGTCPVGTYGSNALGLSDMLGNVSEWASDCWEGDCSRHAAHGGGWLTPPRFRVRNDVGGTARPDTRFTSTGFRVARTLE